MQRTPAGGVRIAAAGVMWCRVEMSIALNGSTGHAQQHGECGGMQVEERGHTTQVSGARTGKLGLLKMHSFRSVKGMVMGSGSEHTDILVTAGSRASAAAAAVGRTAWMLRSDASATDRQRRQTTEMIDRRGRGGMCESMMRTRSSGSRSKVDELGGAGTAGGASCAAFSTCVTVLRTLAARSGSAREARRMTRTQGPGAKLTDYKLPLLAGEPGLYTAGCQHDAIA